MSAGATRGSINLQFVTRPPWCTRWEVEVAKEEATAAATWYIRTILSKERHQLFQSFRLRRRSRYYFSLPGCCASCGRHLLGILPFFFQTGLLARVFMKFCLNFCKYEVFVSRIVSSFASIQFSSCNGFGLEFYLHRLTKHFENIWISKEGRLMLEKNILNYFSSFHLSGYLILRYRRSILNLIIWKLIFNFNLIILINSREFTSCIVPHWHLKR